MKKIVCRPISGQIVYATVTEKENEMFGTIGNDAKDVTSDCVNAMFEHLLIKQIEMKDPKINFCYEKTSNGKIYTIRFEVEDQ